MTKKYDVVAVTGEYTNNQGETKKRYQNVGSIIDKGNGPFLIMDRTFNPAGLPNPENKSSVILSLFSPKIGEEGFKAAKAAVQGEDDSDIPF